MKALACELPSTLGLPLSRFSRSERILGFQEHYQQIASPFQWKCTRSDLSRLLARPLTPAHSSLPDAA